MAKSVGGWSKPFEIPNIEVKLSNAHIQSIVLKYREQIGHRLQEAIPSLESKTVIDNLDSVISGWDDLISNCVSEAKAELEAHLKNMSQLGEITSLVVLGGSELKTNFENKLRAKYAKHSKIQHEARLKIEKLDHEIQRLLMAGTEDFHALKKQMDALAAMRPAPESPASATLNKARSWLDDITPTKCSNSLCPHVGLRRNQQRHALSCLFTLPLITQNAIKRTRPDNCSLGFELKATPICNPEFEGFAGEYYPGPSQHMDDDQEGWFHSLDAENQRILRIKYVDGRWLLTTWEGPDDETVILSGSNSEIVDQASFDGFTMSPLEKLSWATASSGAKGNLAQDSVKLIYFGGMWCPYCPPFTKKLKIFHDLIRKEEGKDVLEIVFASSDRDEEAMLEYYGRHHGDWFALPFDDRKAKQNLSEKFEVSGIPSLHVIGNDGEEIEDFKKGGQVDIRGWIRKLPDSESDAKGQALDLYRLLKARCMKDIEGILGLDYRFVVQSAREARTYESCNANLVGNLKDIMCGKFGDAARGLQAYLKTGPDWDEKANCTLGGMTEEVRSLTDCPECAAIQADELDKLVRAGDRNSIILSSSRSHQSLVEALRGLKSCVDRRRSLALELEKTKDQVARDRLDQEMMSVQTSNQQLRDAVEKIRRELKENGGWYYGCEARSIKWPEHVCVPFAQPLCGRCRLYCLDYTKISQDLNYVLKEASTEKSCFNGVRDYNRVGATLQTFMDSDEAQEARLTDSEVASLRFYTSHSFGSINEALRDSDRAGPHPLPGIVTNIQNGLKKLRAMGADEKQAKEKIVLWRGFRDTQQTDTFMTDGGTELAPMSTTTDVKVAVGYAVRKGQTGRALLFRIETENNLQRGADLQWLSMFPGEAETLYPPLTYMQPTGRTQAVRIDGLDLTVVEVKVTMAAGA